MVQVGRMLTKDIFDIRRAQPLQNIPDGCMSRWPFPSDLKGSVQLRPMDLDEGADAAIRVGTAHNRENGKQQDMRQLVKFAFGAPRIGDCLRAARGNVRITSRQPPNNSVASHKFRLFRSKELLRSSSRLNSETPLLNGLTIER